MSEGGAAFYGRVEVDAEDQRLLDEGWFEAHPGKSLRKGASGGWFRNGAFVVDSEGAGIVDADGVRHALPLPPWGGQLVYVTQTRFMNGLIAHSYYLIVTDEAGHLLFRLPVQGVSDDLAQTFAEAAGLRFVIPDTTRMEELKEQYGDYTAESPYSQMRWSRVDQEHTLGNRLRRLFGKKRPEV